MPARPIAVPTEVEKEKKPNREKYRNRLSIPKGIIKKRPLELNPFAESCISRELGARGENWDPSASFRRDRLTDSNIVLI